MAREIIDGKRSDIKIKTRYPQIEFDKLQMYFGEPYVIDLPSAQGTITIKQPTIGELIRMGESRFYSTLNIFITNTTTYRLMLWELGVDWNEMSDFELFCMLYKQIDDEVASLMFDNLSFSNFELFSKQLPDSEQPIIILYDKEHEIEINEEVYQHICQYLRAVFNMSPEEKITQDANLKEMYINKDKRAIINESKKKNKTEKNNSIQPMISACVNHPGFKYKLQELREVGVCEFYDSVQRLQVYESTTALMSGMYSGFCDTSKMSPDQYNFMREF